MIQFDEYFSVGLVKNHQLVNTFSFYYLSEQSHAQQAPFFEATAPSAKNSTKTPTKIHPKSKAVGTHHGSVENGYISKVTIGDTPIFD